jgi:prepilin-type processing-associated H-X9-DG protein
MNASDSEQAMLVQVSPTMTRSRCPIRSAVSLVELLVVCAIILFLLAMLVPGLWHAKEQARRVQCSNNLRQWGVALQYYRDDHSDYLPTEGTFLQPGKPYTWFNVLPPYLNAPPYGEVERTGKLIKDFPELHVWICPSKNLSGLYKSGTGYNQFHYAMNEVLDGMNSLLTPDFPDQGELPIRATPFRNKPRTVFMFDVYSNQSLAHPKGVATKFHWNFANLLYLDGSVASFHADDFVTGGDFGKGKVIWNHPRLYWGYPPPNW